MEKQKEIKYNAILTAGVMIILIYGIWSTRYSVNNMYIEGSIVSQKNAKDIQDLKVGQQAIIDTLELVRKNNALIVDDHRLLIELSKNLETQK